jgi:transposase-like protein
MALVHVQCPSCQSIDVMKYGRQANGTQRYQCNNPNCARRIFLLRYHDKGRLPEIKRQIVDMTLNGSGVRDIVRVLGVSSTTVIATLKKRHPPFRTSTNDDSRRETPSRWR